MNKDEILEYLRAIKHSSENALFAEIGLFGSYARGEADEFSDIDVAVRIDEEYLKKHDVWEYFEGIKQMKKNLFDRFGKRSDVFDLGSDSPLLENIKKDIIYV